MNYKNLVLLSEQSCFQNPVARHLGLLLTFAVFNVVVPFSDFITDVLTAQTFFQSGHFYWGCCTLLFVFLPVLGKLIPVVTVLAKFERVIKKAHDQKIKFRKVKTFVLQKIETNHKCTRGGEGKVQKLSHKNGIKHEKGDTPRFSDNPQYPPQKNLAKTPRTPPGFPTTVHL